LKEECFWLEDTHDQFFLGVDFLAAGDGVEAAISLHGDSGTRNECAGRIKITKK
jgi:hypothetical protein